MDRLKFSEAKGNSKLKRQKIDHGYTYSLPPGGKCCPFARACKVRIGPDGKLIEGKHMEFRCFGTMSELRSENLRKKTKHNLTVLESAGLRDVEAMKKVIIKSLPPDAVRVRVHTTGGDFMTKEYFQAWIEVAKLYDDVLFYGYTKAIKYYVELKDTFPDNFRFVTSRGGTQDALIDEYNLVEARVVYHPDEAKKLGMEIDHDDSLCMKADKSFALLIHAQQKSGSKAAEALKKMRKDGVQYSYS
jgi:hypothetical protein